MAIQEIQNPALPKVVGMIVLVGVLWGIVPYFERLALTQTPSMTTEYFQLWRGLMVACVVAVYTLVKYRKDLPSVHKALTPKNFGYTMITSISTVIYMLMWLYIVRTQVLRVSVSYSMTLGIAILISAITGYCCTFIKTPALRHLGATLRPENYVGIGLILVGVVLVGLDLRRLPTPASGVMAMFKKAVGGTCPYLT